MSDEIKKTRTSYKRKFPKPVERKCQICGKLFFPDKFHPHQKNCSLKCAKETMRRYQAEYQKTYRKIYPDKRKNYWEKFHE